MFESAYTLFTDVHLRHLESCLARAFSQLSECKDFSTEESDRLIQNVRELNYLCEYAHTAIAAGEQTQTVSSDIGKKPEISPKASETDELPSVPTEPSEPEMTFEDAKKKLVPIARASKNGNLIRELLDIYGVKQLSELDAKVYPELIRKAEAALAAEEG